MSLSRRATVSAVLLLAVGGAGAPVALASVEPCSVYAESCEEDRQPVRDEDRQPVRDEDRQPVRDADQPVGDAPADDDDTSVATADRRGDLGPAPDSLPLTGGELTLLALTGAGALAGGTAMVVAARRRRA